MKMKAAIYYGAYDVRFEEIERPRAEDGIDGHGVVVKIGACGICNHKDIYRYQMTQSPPCATGIALGHEYSGEVVEIGPKTTGIKIGDRVQGYAMRPCLKCEACKAGKYAQCTNLLSGAGGGFVNGGMAEYVLFPYTTVNTFTQLPDNMSYHNGALFEVIMLGVGLGNKAKPGDTAVIMGADMTGLSTVARLREIGAGKIIVCDISKKRLAAAKSLGADIIVNELEEDFSRVVIKETKGEGAREVFVIEPRPFNFREAIDAVKLEGEIWLATEWDVPFTLNPVTDTSGKTGMHRRTQFTIRCPWGTLGLNKPRIQKSIEYIQSGKVTAEKYATVFPLEKIKEAFELAINPHESIKVIVEP
jgi:threonine dehydrogenase-like Zn-dependent dehydrogenase